MFKSVFAKYFFTFTMIILVSYMIIALLVASIINLYFEKARIDEMERTAAAVADYIEDKLEREGMINIPSADHSGGKDISAVLSALSISENEIALIVTDADGSLMYFEGNDSLLSQGEIVIPSDIIDEISNGGALNVEQIKNIFGGDEYLFAVPVSDHNNEVCGTVIVYSLYGAHTPLVDTVIKTIVITISLVLVASLIALYYITERITAPLKEISRAAKSFANGQFDVRVPVRGRDEISELAIAFNNMAESLNNYDNMRNTFISNVSHELRTPMTTISGFVDGILDGVIPPEKHQYYLDIVSREVKRLSRLVTTLLDLSRIQAGEKKFNTESFDVCEMGRQILISFEQKIDEKHLEVEFDVDNDNMTAIADRDAIHQVFYNLCDNAVKFASEGGLLRISVKKYKNKKLVVSVYNDGQGISEADVPYVFERFYKSDRSRGINKSGVGLGLYISKTIINAHGEKIWVDSEYGKSCCFSFTLPQ